MNLADYHISSNLGLFQIYSFSPSNYSFNAQVYVILQVFDIKIQFGSIGLILILF